MSGFDKVVEDWEKLEKILTDEHEAPQLETIKHIFFSAALCGFRIAYAELENAETKDKAVENFSKTSNDFINFLYPR